MAQEQLKINCVDHPADTADFFVTDNDPFEVQLDVSNEFDGVGGINSITMQRPELEKLRAWLDEIL